MEGMSNEEKAEELANAKMSPEDLRARLSEIKAKHSIMQQAITYALTGDQATQKIANKMAIDAYMAALQSVVLEYYDGDIQFAETDAGNMMFKGTDE